MWHLRYSNILFMKHGVFMFMKNIQLKKFIFACPTKEFDFTSIWFHVACSNGPLIRSHFSASVHKLSLVKQLSGVVGQYVWNHSKLLISDLISKMKKEMFAATEARDISVFLDRAFVRLEAWFKWFNTTQAGKFLLLWILFTKRSIFTVFTSW